MMKRLPIDRDVQRLIFAKTSTTMQRNVRWAMYADVYGSQAFLEHYCKVDALYRIAWRISLRMIYSFPSHASEVYIRRRSRHRLRKFVSTTTRLIDFRIYLICRNTSSKDIEINKPISYGIIAVSIGHDPMKHLRSLLNQLTHQERESSLA
jgi:hypothetical protein